MNIPPIRMIPASFSLLRGVGTALVGDFAVLLAFVVIALSNVTADDGLGEQEAFGGDALLAGTATPDMEAGLASAKADLEAVVANNQGNAGLAMFDSQGNLALDISSDRSFVLASVGKLYILAAYLDSLNIEGGNAEDADMELLEAMIRWSDNDAATLLWESIGSEEGLADFLARKGLSPVQIVEEDAWGTLNALVGQVGELIWRLAAGQLLDAGSTELAMRLLSDITYEQAWGISAGVQEPGSLVFLKNGWYPDDDGWRVNSAGAVHTAAHDYVLVILTDSQPTFEAGVGLVEAMARRVNALMAMAN